MVEDIGTGLISCPVDFAVRAALLSSKVGATLDTLVEATGWLPHTTLAVLTGLPKRGYARVATKTIRSVTSRSNISSC